MAEQSDIQRFFNGANVLVTGGTGFLGKVLLESLLRKCPKVGKLFIVVRPKKGKEVSERIEELLGQEIFSTLTGEWRSHIVPIAAVLSEPGMCLSNDDRTLLQNEVNIVFHCAASIRFESPLLAAIRINVMGTKNIVDLCKEMTNLKALVHVSTAFSNCNRKVLDENIHQPGISSDLALRLLDSEYVDETFVNTVTPILLNDWPNTYTFTKCIAEDLIWKESETLPIVIFRPGFVTPTTRRAPLSGFIDNIFTPISLITLIGIGIIRTVRLNKDVPLYLVPVDLCVNGILASAWKVGSNKYMEAPIYNHIQKEQITFDVIQKGCTQYGYNVPTINMIWWFGTVTMIQNELLYKISRFFMHTVPGMLGDVIIMLTGRKPMLLDVYSKIHVATRVYYYFMSTTWKIEKSNTDALHSCMSQADKRLFYMDTDQMDWDDYWPCIVDGQRRFILKDPIDTIPAGQKKLYRLKILHFTLKYMMMAIVFYFLWSCFNKFVIIRPIRSLITSI